MGSIRTPGSEGPAAVLAKEAWADPTDPAPGPWVAASSRALAFLVGGTSLGGQVSWWRVAEAVVGGTLGSAALTLSGAMLGLGAGALGAGSALARTGGRRLLFWALLLGGAVLAAEPGLILGVGGLGIGLTSRRLLVVGIIGLAHLPFGALLPALISWRRIPQDRLAREGGELYALGAFGSVAGALLTSLVLAPRLSFAAIGALLAGLTLASLGLLLVPSLPALLLPRAAEPKLGPPVPKGTLFVGFGLGFLGMAAEMLWTRILGFYWESNTRTFALISASTVLGLSLGSLGASQAGRFFRPGQRGVALGLVLSAIALAGAASQAPLASWVATDLGRLLGALLLVGVPAVFFGGTFVTLLGTVKGSLGGGRAIGWLSAANFAGAAMGPVVLLLFSRWVAWPAQAMIFVASGYALFAARSPGIWSKGVGIVLGGALVGAGLYLVPAGPSPSDYPRMPDPSPSADFEATVFPFVRPGLGSTVVVSRETQSGVETLYIDRSLQGDTSSLGRRIPSLLGRWPGELLGRPARRALVIGLGTGQTLGGVLDSKARSVEVAELSPGVIEANRTVLAESNGHVLERSEVRVRPGDGRSLLSDAEAPYDLILTDMTFPGIVGGGNLFSREFYALSRRRLAPDGLFIHWLPCFQLSPDDCRAVIAAFLEAYPEGSAWIGFLGPRRLILGLAGGALPRPLPEAVGVRLALGPAGLRAWAAGIWPIRDLDPRLEYRSPGRSDAFYGRENLKRLMDAMDKFAPSEDWIEPPGRLRWEASRRAWRLFGQAGLAELRAEAEAPGSREGKEARDRASALYREVSRVLPGQTDAEFLLANDQFERDLESASAASGRGDEEAFLASLRSAASHPHLGTGHLYLADALAARGRFPEAVEELEKAIAKCPRSADAQLKLAMLAHNVRDREKSRKAFLAAASLRPDRPPLYQEVARWLSPGTSGGAPDK